MENVTLYHGTTNLSGIIKRKKILALGLILGKSNWDFQKEQYDSLTAKLSSIARRNVDDIKKSLGLKDILDLGDEALADCASRYLLDVPYEDKLRYGEAKRQTCVYLTPDLAQGKRYTQPKGEGLKIIPGVVQISIQNTMLRPGMATVSSDMIPEVVKEIDLEHATQLYIKKREKEEIERMMEKEKLQIPIIVY